ncbi:hypothetical protein ACFWR9_03925 [Streptomyces sp. NPDC058534]|uniref:hypothetical protein n=1 Tax=Streptomyces sp. NPDC058534 TaxID=3346541 RepID=UPI00364F4D4A
MPILATLAVLGAVMAAAVTVLIRRDRRRWSGSPDTARIEAHATRGLREARRWSRAADPSSVATGLVGHRHDDRGH